MGEGRLYDRASQLRQEDKALSLRQLGAAYGLGYVRIKQMQSLPGFPLIAGKVIPSDFDSWRAQLFGPNSLHRASRPHSAVGKVRALASKSDSQVSWRQIESSLKAAVESLGLPEASGSSDV
jgi:hypothetical protein